MKKVIALLLALIMVFSLVACGASKDTEPSEPAESPAPADSGEKNDPAPADSDESEAPEASGITSANEFEKGIGWELIALPENEGLAASAVSAKLAEEAGVSTIGWYHDDVDPFARDTYKLCYLRMGTMVIHTSMMAAIEKDWIPRLNITIDEFDANNEIDRMMNAIELYAMQGYDGLIVDPDVTVSVRTKELCAELEMPWMPCWNPIVDDNNVRIYPGTSLDSVYCGTMQAKWLIDNYKTYFGDIDVNELGFIFISASFNQNFIENEQGAMEYWLECFPDGQARYFLADCIAESNPVSAEAGYNQSGAIMSAHSEIKYWLVASCLEDYGQGAARVAESQGIDKNVIVCTNGANILIPAWRDGSESGTCWKAALHYGMNMFAEPVLCGLIALIDGRATPENLFVEWIKPGQTGAEVRCDWRIVSENDYQDYLDYIDSYMGTVD